MPNSKYIKGREKEYKIVKYLKNEGYDIAQRTAGSRGVFDVIGISLKNKKINFVQSKSDNISEKQEDKILMDNHLLNGKFNVEFMIA